MSQSIVRKRKRGLSSRSQSASLRGGLKLDGALGGVKGCSHLGDRAPAERKRDVLLELAHVE
jgi:hypothetical protein